MQPVHPVANLFLHSADVAADHRPAVGERLLDHQRRVLPPNRGHDHPIDVGHQLRKLARFIAARQGHVLPGRREQIAGLVLKFFGEEIEICTVDPQVRNRRDPGLLVGQHLHGLEEDGHPFERRQLTEEADSMSSLGAALVGNGLHREPPVFLIANPRARNSPLDKSFEEETARREKLIDASQMGRDEALPQEKTLLRNFREARVAPPRRRFVT